MSLTSDEQHALEAIERGLCRQDPLLADRFTAEQTMDLQQRRIVLARRMMIVGAVLTLIGLMASQGLISLGAILGGYGLLILSIGMGVALRNRIRQET